jgi:saccharopine dehydrogenase-like protein
MAPRILIAGGYGMIGSAIARHIRSISPDAELVLAGRTPEKGAKLAAELTHARTAYVDVADAGSLGDLDGVDLIVAALYDGANTLVQAALARGIAHIGITTKADDVAPIAFAALRSPPRRPIVLAGYCAAGVATIVAQKAAQRFSRIDSIEVAALYDMRDPVGPMTAGDVEMLVSRALLRRGGTWAWVDGPPHARTVRLSDAELVQGYPTGLLDVPSLAALTGAADVRLDMVQGDSLGTRRGGRASSDAYIDIEGALTSGEQGRRRTIVSDPNGLAHLTALGVLVAAERVLGLDGKAPAAGGLYLPETLVSADAAIARFEQFGASIIDV